MQSLTDKALMERWIRHHDAGAFAEIVSRYAGMVYATCRRILRNPSEAEDAAQDCFFGLAKANEPIVPALGAWLHRVATHRSLDVLRKETRRREREKEFVETLESSGEPEWNEIERHVDGAIADLPDKLRVLLVNHFLEGQSYAAIAERLGLPRSTIASRVERGIRRVRSSLKKQGILVTIAGLAAMLGHASSEAAPQTLLTTLGKVAVAGTAGKMSTGAAAAAQLLSPTAPKLLVTGGIAMTVKTKAGIAVVALVVLGLAGTLTYEMYKRAGQPVRLRPNKVTALQGKLLQAVSQGDTGTVKTVGVAAKPAKQQVEESSPPSNDQSVQEKETEAQPASVSGWVVDEQLYGIAGATVQLHTFKDPDAHYLIKTYTTQSAPDGAFEIKGIDTFRGARLFAYATGYVHDRDDFGWIKLAPGMARENVQVKLKKGGFLVTGRVVDEARQGLAGAMVKLLLYGYTMEQLLARSLSTGGTNSSYSRLAVTDEKGYFEMAITVEGLCDFSVAKEGYGPGVFPAIMTGTTDALFVLHSPGAVAGRVTRLNGDPASDVRVDVVGEAGSGGQDPENAHVPVRFGLGLTTTRTGPDGAYRLEGLGEECFYAVKASNAVPETANKGDSEAKRPDDPFDVLSARQGLNVQRGVRVKAGQTTEVDLVLPDTGKIFGRVTDTQTGRPLHPFRVIALSLDEPAGARFYDTRTDTDGWYALVVDVDRPTQFSVKWRYSAFCGNDVNDNRQGEDFAPVEVGPDDEKQFDFSVSAPVSVPVRCVDRNDGHSRSDVLLMLRSSDEPGKRWSAEEVVDPNGQAVLEGLAPNDSFQALAVTRNNNVVGMTEPFSGKPGETLPEVLLACDPVLGGIEGTVSDSSGNPAANVPVAIGGLMPDGTTSDLRTSTTDENGHFTIPDGLPEGAYTQVLIGYEQSDQAYLAVVGNVTSVAGEVTDIGEVKPEPIPPERANELLRQFPERS